MQDNQYVVLEKEKFNGFISKLSEMQKLVGPVSKGFNNFAFEEVSSGEEIALKYIPTILPLKKYFMPQRETLLEFKTGRGAKTEAVVEYEPVTIFGAHTCDLAGIQCLNMVFSQRPKDYNYLTRKSSSSKASVRRSRFRPEQAASHRYPTVWRAP